MFSSPHLPSPGPSVSNNPNNSSRSSFIRSLTLSTFITVLLEMIWASPLSSSSSATSGFSFLLWGSWSFTDLDFLSLAEGDGSRFTRPDLEECWDVSVLFSITVSLIRSICCEGSSGVWFCSCGLLWVWTGSISVGVCRVIWWQGSVCTLLMNFSQ